MKFSWKRLGKFLAVLVLIVLNVSIGFYVLANIFDWKIDTLNINPSEKPDKIRLTFQYPTTSSIGVAIGNTANSILFEIIIKYNSTLIERQPVELIAGATLSPQFAQEINSVSIGFEGTVPYSKEGNVLSVGSGFGVSLYPSNTQSKSEDLHAFISLGSYLVGDSTVINWQVQGDYYPTISIDLKNQTTIYQNYQDYRIPVSSSDVERQDRYSRINTALSIALTLFAFVESFALITRLLSKKSSSESNNVSSQNTAHNPETKAQKWKPNKYQTKKQEQKKT